MTTLNHEDEDGEEDGEAEHEYEGGTLRRSIRMMGVEIPGENGGEQTVPGPSLQAQLMLLERSAG